MEYPSSLTKESLLTICHLSSSKPGVRPLVFEYIRSEEHIRNMKEFRSKISN